MKKTVLLLVLTFVSIFSFSQNLEVPFTGNYELLPNPKVTYDFNKVRIESATVTLYMNEKVVRVLDLVSYNESMGYMARIVYPELPAEMKASGNMFLKTEFNDQGNLHVLVSGNGNHEEHYLKRIIE